MSYTKTSNLEYLNRLKPTKIPPIKIRKTNIMPRALNHAMNPLTRIQRTFSKRFSMLLTIKTPCVFFILVLGLQLTGCSRDPTPPKLVNSYDSYDKYEVHYEPGLTEQWNDPDILSTPRIQFTWAPPGGSRFKDATVWSMRLEGSDLRQVVSLELFKSPTSGGIKPDHYFSRSPNNRYLAYTMGSKAGYERRLIDLETQTVKVLGVGRGSSDPQFRWFKGGRYLTFFGRGLTQYDIETDTITEIHDKYDYEGSIGYNHYSVDNGNNMLILSASYIEKFDFETGELIEKFEGFGRHLTLDEKYWLHHGSDAIYVTPFNDTDNKLFSLNEDISTALFSSLTAAGPYITAVGGGVVISYKDNKKEDFYTFPENRIAGNMSFINYHNFIANLSDQE